jgi:predicted HicB family RNase H-like nuclease
MKENILTYKGFIGSVHFSSDDAVFFGKIEGINDLITFEGETVKELTSAFHYVVDEHIKDCKAQNIAPEKSYKGSFNVRVSPELHRRIAISARMRGETLNHFVRDALNKAASE